MTWATRAQTILDGIAATLPAGASYDDHRKAFRASASRFHGGTSWGKKIWPRECRRWLLAHFRQSVPGSPSGYERIPPRDDITFPFRGESGHA